MDMREALVKTAAKFKGGMKGLSLALGFGENGLRNRIYELKDQKLHLETAELMQEMTDTTFIAEAISMQAGGVFFKLPDVSEINDDELNDKFMQLHAELGELMKTYFEATHDGEIDPKEKKNLIKLQHQAMKTLREWQALSFRVYCREEKQRHG